LRMGMRAARKAPYSSTIVSDAPAARSDEHD